MYVRACEGTLKAIFRFQLEIYTLCVVLIICLFIVSRVHEIPRNILSNKKKETARAHTLLADFIGRCRENNT